ncbi:MAG TPA: GNAT family N-acetyltransferase [Caulobacter sp.]|nr:GNAT family N-acetyltransferase [Caulobacter sp.]
MRIEKLRRDHAIDAFDCGGPALNRFLQKHALQSQQSGASQTYLALESESVVGFHSLVVGQIDYADAAERLTKGLARHPVPVMILARLAIAATHQGKGLGAGLLKDAMARTLAAADIAGIRAFIVHAKDERARRFYERFDFLPSPTDPNHLFALMKDVRAALGN